MFVKEVMKKDIKTIPSNATVLEAAKLMTANNIGSLVIVDDAGDNEDSQNAVADYL